MSLLLAVDVGNTNVVLGVFDLERGPESPLLWPMPPCYVSGGALPKPRP